MNTLDEGLEHRSRGKRSFRNPRSMFECLSVFIASSAPSLNRSFLVREGTFWLPLTACISRHQLASGWLHQARKLPRDLMALPFQLRPFEALSGFCSSAAIFGSSCHPERPRNCWRIRLPSNWLWTRTWGPIVSKASSASAAWARSFATKESWRDADGQWQSRPMVQGAARMLRPL
jgi:hypothetical protein